MKYSNAEEYIGKALSFVQKDESAFEDASKICSAISSLEGIASTDAAVLQNLSGCNAKSTEFIRLLVSLTSRRITDGFKSVKGYSDDEIKRYVCALLFHLTVESVYMFSFDKCGRMISADLVTEGTINSSAFLPRKIVDIALRRRASSVILAHNHPSGNIAPSDNDIAVTLLAQTVLRDAHVDLTAHYITVGFKISDCMDGINNPIESKNQISKINPAF